MIHKRIMTTCIIALAALGLPSILYGQEPVSLQKIPQESEPKETLPTQPQVATSDWQKIAKKLSFIAQIDAYYSLSDRSGADTLSGFGLASLLAPGYRFNDKSVILLMYDAQYYEKREFYSDLIGPRERTEFQSHTLTPIFNYDYGDESRYSVKPSLFYSRTYNKDVAGGGWGDGLYNYEDIGIGVDWKMRRVGFAGADGAVKLGLQYYTREYPNYESLLDLATGIGIEEDERDYDGILMRTGYSWGDKGGFSWGADYYLLRKALEGKKVVDSNGVLTGEEQRDYLHGLSFSFFYTLETIPALRMAVDLTANLNKSNQNYYDGLGTVDLTDDIFMEGFYDYDAYGIRPTVSYTLPIIPRMPMPITTSISYFYQQTDYSGRRAQASGGTYKDETQEETQNEVTLNVQVDMYRRMSLFLRFQYLKVESNNDNEEVYSYNHKLTTYYAGFKFRY